ncbi:MAG: caspase family protein [Planctomycetes bacterium]|nr:caspase family protein [Planctomycetota bacterium]
MSERARWGLVLVGLWGASLCSGCASIPDPEQVPNRLFAEANPIPLRLALSEVEVTLSVQERAKAQLTTEPKSEEKYSISEVIDFRDLRREVRAWLEAGQSFARVRVAEGEGAQTRRLDAWARRDDLLLELELRDFRTQFDGHNWLWIPNVINWAYWIVPSWFIATEEYSLDLTVVARIRQLGGGPAIGEVEVPIHVEGTFGEFQRGWQFFGPIYPVNGSGNWRAIAKALWPAALAKVGRGVATALREMSIEIKGKLQRRELTKTLVLTVGVSHYEDTVQLPTLPFAVADARAAGAALARVAGLLSRQVLERHEAEATLSGVEEAFAELADRAREGDTVVIYFAGYGGRDAQGRPHLLLNGPPERAQLSFARLAELLAPIAGNKALILDCGFDDRQARAVSGPASPTAGTEIAALAKASGSGVLAAASPGGSLLVPGHLEQSLFGHCVVEALGGFADRDHDLVLSFSELAEYVRRKTTAESAFLDGRPQRPQAAGGEQFRLNLRKEVK